MLKIGTLIYDHVHMREALMTNSLEFMHSRLKMLLYRWFAPTTQAPKLYLPNPSKDTDRDVLKVVFIAR